MSSGLRNSSCHACRVPFDRREMRTTAEDARALLASHWPGNVRELCCVIEPAMITSKDGRTLNLRSIK